MRLSALPFSFKGDTSMKLYEALDITLKRNELACFVGAGGKTTSLFRLAGELKECNKRVLVTTTTAICCPDKSDCDEVIVDVKPGSDVLQRGKTPWICVIGREVTADNKLLGMDKEYVTELYLKKVFDYILVEADGSRQRPIKAPADHEPVIPDAVTRTVGVIGLDALGVPISSASVHRPERFCRLTGKTMGDRVDEEAITRLIRSPEGLFKAVPEGSRKYILFNKSERSEQHKSVMCIIDAVETEPPGGLNFIIANMFEGSISKVI